MLKARTIESIQQEYFAALAAAGSGLSLDQTEGSLAYTLSRATAAIASAQDNRMIELERDSSLLTAVGERLDVLASPILSREPSSPSTGFVLAIAKKEPVFINNRTVLVHLPSSYQFVISEGLNVLNLYEISIKVTCLQAGSAGNLAAGTSLFSPDYPDVCFHVGSVHTDKYYGDLLGGRDAEVDELYRNRVLRHLLEGPSSSESALERKLLSYPLVQRASVRTRTPGVLEIWVDSDVNYTESQRQELLSFVRGDLAAGVVPALIQAQRKLANLTIDVKPFSNSATNLSALSSRLSSVISSFLAELDIGESLNLALLQRALKPLARQVTILYPLEDIVCAPNEILVSGDLKYVFPSNS